MKKYSFLDIVILTVCIAFAGFILFLVLNPRIKPTTNIKSIDTVTYANIKSVDGVAIASVKSFNGLA